MIDVKSIATEVEASGRKAAGRRESFYVSLAACAAVAALLMLVFMIGYMLLRGSKRIFFSPVYELSYKDGRSEILSHGWNVEFQTTGGDGVAGWRNLSAARRFERQAAADAVMFASIPVEGLQTIEIHETVLKQEADPWAEDGEEAAKVSVGRKERTAVWSGEELKRLREIRLSAAERPVLEFVFEGAPTRKLAENAEAFFLMADGRTLGYSALVSAYLEKNPEEKRRRERAGAEAYRRRVEEVGGADPVEPTWPVRVLDADGRERETAIGVQAVRIHERWNWFSYFWQMPRNANTEGGVLPCIFGTVLMTLLMTILVSPLGVLTAVYLREYARDTWPTRLIRQAVANLAAVPSIVFGLFGLGFFVLMIGGGIDGLFFKGDKVFGTPCLLWAACTLALMTLPVVIVATEEALRTVPRELREGAMSLGATKLQTILTVVLPAARSGILTGVILALSRGAGEVAPLLLTGVVPHKDSISADPLDKFMNLAYHVYDLALKSPPNKIEEAQSMAFSAALLLLLVVLLLNLLVSFLRVQRTR